MSHTSAARLIGLTIALTAPIAAAVALSTSSLVRRLQRRRPVATPFGIHRVPVRPPLWDARPSTGPLPIMSLRDVAPVSQVDSHAPAAYATLRRRG